MPRFETRIAVIGDKLFILRRKGVTIVGPGYIRYIPNSWYTKEDIEQL